MPSQGHSAHIGEFVTVHYPHHPLFGTRVRCQSVDQRSSGAVAHIETAPGHVIVIPTWMLDAIACTGMEIDEPRVSLDALIDLAGLLTAQCARESSLTATTAIEEVTDETADGNSDRGAAPDEHGVRIGEDARDEPTANGSRHNGVGDIAGRSSRHCREGEAQ